MIQRNLEQTRSGGGDCAISLGGTSLEIKRQERSNLPAWLAQAREQAGEDVPALAYRANRQPWRVLVELTPEQYCYLIREEIFEEAKDAPQAEHTHCDHVFRDTRSCARCGWTPVGGVRRMKLLPHQIEDAEIMAKRHFFGNFSGMGSGKTLTALEAARLALKDMRGGYGMLIIAPPIALPMWAEEAERHLQGLPVEIVRTGKQTPLYAGVVVMSYAIATKRIKRLSEVGWAAVIMDESHALKSPGAQRTQALLGDTLTHGASGRGLLDSAEHVWVLTGTPMTRWPDDLYPFLLRADPQGMKARCGGTSIERFWLRYCVRQNKVYGRKRVTATVGARNTIELNEWIYSEDRPLAVRRRLQDVWDQMPPLTKTKLVVPLESSQS